MAHGGQSVITADTREAGWRERPAGVRFRSLGAFGLRGLPHEVPLYQVLAPGLASRFPPLRLGHGS